MEEDSSAVLTSVSGQDTPLPSLRAARDSFERTYLIEALRRAGGNVSAAAKLAGRNRTDFHDLLRKHGLSGADFKS
jgi:two-component system response regulator GlrR